MNAGAPAGRALRNVAGAVFTGLLVWAPLNFGSTRAGGPELLTAGCAAGTVLWAAARGCDGRPAQIPAVAACAAALFVLAVLPWSLGLYAPTSVLPFTEMHFARIATRWPQSIVWRDPTNAAALAIALAAAVLPLIDLAHERRWLFAFCGALTATAVVVSVIALAQNYTNAPGIYWRAEGRLPGNFCGPFFHHTSAGAYFNTAWPLAVALTWLAWERVSVGTHSPALGIGLGLATIVLLAGHTSHVSRFPQVAALLVASLLWRGLTVRRAWRRPLLVAGLAALAVFAGLVAATGRAGDITARWRLVFAANPAALPRASSTPAEWPALMRGDLFVPSPLGPGLLGIRREGWLTALRSIAARPVTGHGPANWIGAASHHSADPFVRTFYQFLQFAHQDTLQSAVEWGLPAAICWWLLLVGGAIAGLRASPQFPPARRVLGLAAGCGLLAVLLQAQIDFPLQIPAVAFNAVVLAALGWASARGPAYLTP